MIAGSLLSTLFHCIKIKSYTDEKGAKSEYCWKPDHAVDLDASKDLNFRHFSKKRLFINQLIYTAFCITFNSYKSYVFITFIT